MSDTRPGPVDVTAVLASIRDRIRRDGVPKTDNPDEIEALAAARFQELADEAGADSGVVAGLLESGRGWNVSPDYPLVTHRRGLAGRLVVLLKRLVRAPLRLYTDPIVGRQAQLNVFLVGLCQGLLRETVRLEGAEAALARRCDDLEARLARVEPPRSPNPPRA